MMKGKIRLYYNTIASNNHKIETICDYVIFPGLGMLLKMSLVYRKFAIDWTGLPITICWHFGKPPCLTRHEKSPEFCVFKACERQKKSYSTCDSKTSTILLAWSIFSAMIFNNLIGLGALKWSQKRSQPPPAHPFRETLGRARCAPRLFLGTRGDPPSCASWGGQDLCFKRLNPVP